MRVITIGLGALVAAALSDCTAPSMSVVHRRKEFDDGGWPFREVVYDNSPRMTKREKREMMQRDFALGGSRHGRKRRQRIRLCRHKE